ncbi:hypothetical protein ACFSTC_04850 [Nonomuraea ferruginea]
MAFMIALTLAVVVGALLGMSVSGIASQAEEAYRRMRGGARDRRGGAGSARTSWPFWRAGRCGW